MQAINYRPEIDGLRALSVLAVIAFHFEPSSLPNGYLGVDVFFVISGFLITSLIQAGFAAGNFSFAEFYLRRVRRLFPAMALMLAGCLAYGMLNFPPWTLRSLGAQVLFVLGFAANLKMRASAADYWGERSQELPLLHTWSLAVEEQFYIVFPLILIGLLRFGRRWLVPVFAVTGFMASIAICWRWSVLDSGAAFYLLAARAWELLAGCIVALGVGSWSKVLPREARLGPVIGLVVILISLLIPAHDGRAVLGLRLLAVLGAVAFIVFTAGSGGWVKRLFSTPAIVGLGRMSYSLYLWHWPVIVICRLHTESPLHGLDPRWLLPAASAVTALLAAGSYFAVERPLRRREWTPWLCLGTAAALACVAGLVRRVRDSQYHDPKEVVVGSGKAGGSRFDTPVSSDSLYSLFGALASEQSRMTNKYPYIDFRFPTVTPSMGTGVVRPGDSQTAEVMMTGDSHALANAAVVDGILASNRISGVFWMAQGVPPNLFRGPHGDINLMRASEVDAYDRVRLESLKRHPKACVVSMRYDNADFSDWTKTFDAIVANTHLIFVQQAPVLNIGDQPARPVFDSYFRIFGAVDGLNIREPRKSRQARRRFEAELLKRYSGNRNVTFFAVESDLLFPDMRIRWWDGSSVLYYIDDDHLSEAGVRLYAGRLAKLLLGVVSGK